MFGKLTVKLPTSNRITINATTCNSNAVLLMETL